MLLVDKGVFCLIISYLQIKSYNVLNYNNCSTDWPFPLNKKLFSVAQIDNNESFFEHML